MNNRIKGLDLYRMVACAFVIINHCNSKVLLQVTPKSLAWFVTVGVIYITKICVPGFFMITGYNLLHRREDYKTYISRIVRITVDLAVFSLFYYVWRCIIHTIPVSVPENDGTVSAVLAYIKGYIGVVWHGGATDAFWYLYTYLGILIMMPVFQILAGKFDKDNSKVLLIILAIACVYVSVIPSVSVLYPSAAFSEDFILPMLCTATLYLFTGHLIYLHSDRLGAGSGLKIKDILLVAVFLAGFVLNMILAMAEYGFSGGESFIAYSGIGMTGMLIESVSAFILFLKIRAQGALGKVINLVAPATFGIYLFADFMCSNTHMVYYCLCPYMNRLAACAVQVIAAYTTAFAVTYVLRLIPGVRKWI